MRRASIILFFLLIFILPLQSFAQGFTVDPNAHITWPLPVYVMRGQFEVRGTANLANMVNYFLEYRPLNDDLTPIEAMSWIPATLPSTVKVVDDVLATWDTSVTPDGLYELRMTLTVTGGNPVYVIVSPVRIENAAPPFVIIPASPTVVPTNTPPPVEIPTLAPTPTQIDLTPRAEVIVDSANVRTGDSTAYPVMDGLNIGTIVEIVGLSNTGSGWYQIVLPDARRGWMSPQVIRVSGDVRNVPRISPPPPPPPTATPTPATQANLAIQSISLNPDPPVCRQTMTVTVTVVNNGTGPSGGGAVSIQDIHLATGSNAGSTSGVFPDLAPGQTFASVMRLTVDTFFNETHRINVTVDSGGQVLETNEGDNGGFRDYTLQRGSCG